MAVLMTTITLFEGFLFTATATGIAALSYLIGRWDRPVNRIKRKFD